MNSEQSLIISPAKNGFIIEPYDGGNGNYVASMPLVFNELGTELKDPNLGPTVFHYLERHFAQADEKGEDSSND